MTHVDSERDPVDVLAEEFAARCRRGESPSASEYAERHPELADQLRELLPPVAMIEQLKSHKQGAAATLDAKPLARVGDFRIVREVGRGGMGIVYEAVQGSLGRVVALKVLPRHALLDPKKRERFQREAQAAALLHHTNIVPVFGVGEEDGLPYYVMQLIEGKGLHEVIAEWKGSPTRNLGHGAPTTIPVARLDGDDTATRGHSGPGREARHSQPADTQSRDKAPGRWAKIANIGIQAAQALDFAHRHGTLHRDVKPANLLLDRKGTVWVTDFGLAKLAGHEDLTRTGDVLGTLNYMAPESFQGQADRRSDIYSLGLTLYEMLTLEPPFGERDPAKLLKQVSEQEPPRPRHLNYLIPRDLETIVLKAIARDPRHRFQTAGELADDLQRFLEDRPIQARRVTPLERLGRWCRRNRTVAALTALAFSLFLLTTAIGWLGYVSTRDALRRESIKSKEATDATKRETAKSKEAATASGRAVAASKKAEQNVQFFLDCFEQLFDNLAAREQRAVPIRRNTPFGVMVAPPTLGTEDDAALMRSILQFYDRFAERNATNPKLRHEAAKAYRRVGQIHRRLKQFGDAETAFRHAAAIYEKLAADLPGSPDYPVGLARARAMLGGVLDGRNNTKEAEALLRKAIAVPAATVDGVSEVSMALAELCLARLVLADLVQRRGEATEPRTLRKEAVNMANDPRLLTKLLDKDVWYMANAFAELAAKLSQWGQVDQAKALLEKADALKKKGLSLENRNVPGDANQGRKKE